MEELRHCLLYTTLELETTRLAAQEEIKWREDQITYLKDLLTRTAAERDEAHDKCQRLLVEKFLLQHHQQTTPLSGVSSIEDDPRRGDSGAGAGAGAGAGLSSDCEESIVSSPVVDPIPATTTTIVELEGEKALPEKGKLLEAVMKAGPLLQNLLLAGPLPQWRHPPPQIDSFEIPPVAIPSLPICGTLNKKKRGLLDCEASDSSTNTKQQSEIENHSCGVGPSNLNQNQFRRKSTAGVREEVRASGKGYLVTVKVLGLKIPAMPLVCMEWVGTNDVLGGGACVGIGEDDEPGEVRGDGSIEWGMDGLGNEFGRGWVVASWIGYEVDVLGSEVGRGGLVASWIGELGGKLGCGASEGSGESVTIGLIVIGVMGGPDVGRSL
ncbi:hypothetical protein HHK36_018146 [Tetracentron sinense]|uniref:Uncharacterized protein n=1 Tax=Tetracentron sinense TaxID=13715 RepID=A0A834YY96_TETSI|nr:hypothetical protein HHK36_018146 [Tetracentron sinense]